LLVTPIVSNLTPAVASAGKSIRCGTAGTFKAAAFDTALISPGITLTGARQVTGPKNATSVAFLPRLGDSNVPDMQQNSANILTTDVIKATHLI